MTKIYRHHQIKYNAIVHEHMLLTVSAWT